MTMLQRLFDEQGQSPWLDNLTRVYLRDGTLGRLVEDGIRGVTANPTIFARAIEGSDAYDEQFAARIAQGRPVTDAYWDLVVEDIGDALGVLRPTFDSSGGTDGFVSVEVAPELARDPGATIAAARQLHERIAQPNLLVKIPATGEGVPAIQAMIAEGRSINITLIFSLARYAEVIEAYLAGLETFARRGVDPADEEAGSTPRSTVAWTPSAPATRWRCGAWPRSPRPSWPTGCSVTASPAGGGSAWPPGAPSRSGRCGRRRRPRTPPTPTLCMSTASSGPTRSPPCPSRPSPPSRTTGPSPAPSTAVSATPRR
jgi:hypothetical protein